MKYRFLLFDADDTVFDFAKTAQKCFTETSELFGMPSKPENYLLYSEINQKYWDMYSVGKIGKEEIIPSRFKEYGEITGIDFDIRSFAKTYESKLASTAILFTESVEVLSALHGKGFKIYIITNGRSTVQHGRLKLSGITDIIDGIFISDEMNCAKPSAEYFNKISSSIPDFDKNSALIIGDSLVSDMPLGINNGVKTCLVNRSKKVYADSPADYIISDLTELFNIVI